MALLTPFDHRPDRSSSFLGRVKMGALTATHDDPPKTAGGDRFRALGRSAMNEEQGNAGAPSSLSPGPDSTFELIRRVRAGDREALDRLFARHLAPLRRWASGRLPRGVRDLADTDDLVQDTLLKTLKTMEGFEPRRVGALQAYLRQAVLNRVRDEFRHKRRRPDQTGLDDIVAFGGESPLEEAIGRQAVESYEQALARLRPEER